MPGVSEVTFRQLLHYLYTDRIPPVPLSSCVPLVELANRLCLTRLVQLVEQHMAEELHSFIESGSEVTMECLALLEPCQVVIFWLSLPFYGLLYLTISTSRIYSYTTQTSWQIGA